MTNELKEMSIIWAFTMVCLAGFMLLALTACSKVDQQEPQVSVEKAGYCNLMFNGGGACTSDWTDNDHDGIADRWMIMPGTQANIGNDGDWHTAFQRVERSNGQFCLLSPPAPDDGKNYHTVTFRYKSNTRIWCAVQYQPRCLYVWLVLEPASEITQVSKVIWSPRIYTLKFYNSPCFPGWFEIDKLNVY